MTYRITSTMATYTIKETIKTGMTMETAERTLANMKMAIREKYPEIRITRSGNLVKFWFDNYYVTIRICEDEPKKALSISN